MDRYAKSSAVYYRYLLKAGATELLQVAADRYDEITAPLCNQYERVKEARSEASRAKQERS